MTFLALGIAERSSAIQKQIRQFFYDYVLFKNSLTQAADAETAGAGTRGSAAQVRTVVGGVAGPVGPHCGLARIVFPGYNREEGKNCKEGGGKLYSSVIYYRVSLLSFPTWFLMFLTL